MNTVDISSLPLSVIVIGAGPVGLVSALALKSYGLSVLVIEADAEEKIRPGSRALFLHHDSLKLLERFYQPLAQRFFEKGFVWQERQTYFSGKLVYSQKISTERLGTEIFPPFVSLRQSETEKLLREACNETGINILWEEPVQSVNADKQGVRIVTNKATYYSKYALGADGASSETRNSLNIKLVGDSSPGTHIVIDFISENSPYQQKRTFHYKHPQLEGRNVLIIPFAGGWQVDLQCKPDDDVDWMISQKGLRSWLSNLIEERFLSNIDWVSTYRFNQVVAECFVDEYRRVLLVGEAAHLFPPYGARGLNSGIADADVAAQAITLATVSTSESRRKGCINDFDLSRRTAAIENCRAAKQALNAIRTPRLIDKAKLIAALLLSNVYKPSARWLDAAPYGPALTQKRFPTRY
ncbi:3-(3-hydroxy-phenyl)propionate hydroxylase [Xenorhabdus cabanillasii]|uniref:3-(3-hydroxy-phenyl)propionate hydroxylase n=1 Tax=Xenorhabdus cabanillasii TaxID=351673 RepID=A0A3D9UEZ2_9GAMM|nr:NAD(P)/FAD-dependent oxidoreductase [Xenorhabdus cabanillasii]REF26470.1 3-(3-hydroxy-phenyl)propionate hydroxylase [Xenorhabdus cabanillasii]